LRKRSVMSILEAVGSTAAGLAVTGAWDKFMRLGQEDSSKMDNNVLLSAKLAPVNVQVQEMMLKQQKAIAELEAQLTEKNSADAQAKLQQKQAQLEKMTTLAPPKQARASVEKINSAANIGEAEPSSHVVNVGSEYTVVEGSEIAQSGEDAMC